MARQAAAEQASRAASQQVMTAPQPTPRSPNVESHYAPLTGGQFIAGVSEVRPTIRYEAKPAFEAATDPRRPIIRESQETHGAVLRRRNRAVGETISPESLAGEQNGSGWIQIEDPNGVERVERIRYYERDVDGE
ncbi:MAG: hypothetical protein QM811_17185 [Pirellulales bacterium]